MKLLTPSIDDVLLVNRLTSWDAFLGYKQRFERSKDIPTPLYLSSKKENKVLLLDGLHRTLAMYSVSGKVNGYLVESDSQVAELDVLRQNGEINIGGFVLCEFMRGKLSFNRLQEMTEAGHRYTVLGQTLGQYIRELDMRK